MGSDRHYPEEAPVHRLGVERPCGPLWAAIATFQPNILRESLMSEAFIICLNIERFRELLSSCGDDSRREMLLTLLEEEERKLGNLSQPSDELNIAISDGPIPGEY